MLHNATSSCNLEIIKYILKLDHGPLLLEKKNSQGLTPVQMGVMHQSIISYLLENVIYLHIRIENNILFLGRKY